MTQRQRGLRHEIAGLLGVDQITQEFVHSVLPPPTERLATHLANLIAHATNHLDEARVVYSYLPALVFRIFGYEVGQGWLETCSEYPSRDREAIVALVLPDGPIHQFCMKYTHKRTDRIEKAERTGEMHFEFPRSNLPEATDVALNGVDVGSRSTVSYLAPLLAPYLKDPKDQNVLLAPLEYFYICMIASPARKWVASRNSNTAAKIPKRSRSLPSVRAQYNQVIAAYASKLNPSARVDEDDIFIPACLDFLFIPWTRASSDFLPRISTSAADAVASLLITLAPKTPEDLDPNGESNAHDTGSHGNLKLSTNSAALYRYTGEMLNGVFTHFDSSLPPFPLIAYVRVLSVFVAPWRGSMHAAGKEMLFPKPKPPSTSNASRSPSMSALSSTLSSINAHLPSPSGSPTNVTAVKESKWRSALHKRQSCLDFGLLRKIVILSANRRLATTADGCRVLAVLGEASYAARLSSNSSSNPLSDDKEELELCLEALREQKMQLERSSPRKEKNFISLFATCLGVRTERGSVLSGFSDMVHAGSTNGVAGMVSMVSNVRLSTPSSLSKRKQQEQRTSALYGVQAEKVPFFGSVWDRPIAHGENETMVLVAYWLALRLEPALGYIPDTRILGQYWVWVMVTMVLAGFLCIRQLLFSFGKM